MTFTQAPMPAKPIKTDDDVSGVTDLFSVIFVGQMKLIAALQTKCATSSDERDHENLASAIEGYEAMIAIASRPTEGMYMVSRNDN